MTKRIVHTRVAGVTFEGRQALIEQLTTSDPCRIVPEPDNQFDENALAVQVSHGGNVWKIGYIPRDVAAIIAPFLDGESVMCRIERITGGFSTSDDERASYGVVLRIDLPDAEW